MLLMRALSCNCTVHSARFPALLFFLPLVIEPAIWGHVLPLFSACNCRSILTCPPPPRCNWPRRYCQKEAVTGANRGTGSTSSIANKGAYSLFMSGTVAAVYKHSTHQSICIYCNLKQAAKSFIPSKQRVEFAKERKTVSDSCKSSLSDCATLNSTTQQQDQDTRNYCWKLAFH